ncbi:TIGR02679 family protein [Actinopolyspora mortivallis]|uniref:TIGR02679 family protein n=1 Tax=Actinopolyspora mortivallis TaxID=33906 RepID=UPI000379C541|nr:TIGR02679 family protein [Actinopolyspora mortivallis]
MSEVEDVRAVWDVPELHGLWEKARQALEAPDRPATFRLELPDERTRKRVGEVYGRPMWGQGTRINVAKLDRAVRDTRFGLDLERVLEILHGRPVTRRESASAARAARNDRVTEVFTAALTARGLDSAPWAAAWVSWIRRYGRVAEQDLEPVAEQAAAVLSRMVLTPGTSPRSRWSRAELAARAAGGAHLLDNGTTLSRVVLRAAAIAHETDPPNNERERRYLWETCGVSPDAVSATVLCWALPIDDTTGWAAAVTGRTEAGLPTHLTQLDLRAAPERLVRPATVVAVCENPRVLEAAVESGIRHPLVCVSGRPSTVAAELLDRLGEDGAVLRYHGDFDWSGISIMRSLWTTAGVRPWRMSAADYRSAVDLASAERTDLPILDGEAVETPWDPDLAEVMSTAGRVVEEETVLTWLLADLRAGL